MAQKLKDYFLLGLFFAGVIILSPILIPLFIIDDIREDSHYDNRRDYYRRYI
jgi:hypothetical protein